VTEYSDEERLNIIEEHGGNPAELQRQADEATRAQAPTVREGDLARCRGLHKSCIKVAQGITVPREKIADFLSYVVRELSAPNITAARSASR
jgi:hypothetical protein